MGNDGGSIPTRRELVKEAARDPSSTQIKESQHEQQGYYWTTDPISQKPLTQPVVSDCHGKLYNKETILEFLAEGARKEDAENVTQGAVKSLKDVVEVKFEETGAGSKKTWKCPVTGDELGPGSKAIYLVPCGHAFSAHAIKEVSGKKCLTCDAEYAANDVIPILTTTATDIARLALRVKTLQEKGLSHSLKKASGGKKRKKKDEAVDNPVSDGRKVISADATAQNTHESEDAPKSKVINNASTASLTAKVLEEQERSKKRKMENDNVRSLFSSRDASKPHGKSADFMTRGFSLPSGKG